MSGQSEGPNLSAAGAAIRNPLSVIAMFVLLVEVIATVTLVNVLEKPEISLPIAWFIVVFPTLIAILFFGTIWWRHQFLYSPYEYRSDESFLSAMKRLEKIEVRQEAANLNPITSDEDQSIAVVNRLLSFDDVRGALKVGRTYLQAKQADTALRIFEHIKKKSSNLHPERYAIFSNIAYALIEQKRYTEALENLTRAMNSADYIPPWHQLAAAYAHKMLSKNDGDEHDELCKKFIGEAKDNSISFNTTFFKNLYPEIAQFL